MTEGEIASMLATANATAGEGAVNSVDPEGNYTPEPVAPVAPQPDADGIIKGVKPDDMTPEEALAYMDKIEGKNQPPVEPVVEAPVVPTITPEDFDALSLDEKIAHLQSEKDKEAGIVPNPLAKIDEKLAEEKIDVSAMEAQYLEDGELNAESLASLKKAGFDDTAIEAYITTKVAQETARSDKAIDDICGSRENFDGMSKWMTENLSDAELDKYNAGVKGEHYQTYLENMFNKFQGANPAPTRTIRQTGAPVVVTASEGYASSAEMIVAMQNPRYKNDVAYRNSVIRKVQKMNK